MILVQNVMLFSAMAGVVGTLCFGLFMGRRLSGPIVQVASALSRIAKGDLTANVQVPSQDEIGQMAEAMNVMVEALRTSEDRLRALSDNLPNGMVYQTVRDHDGSMRFRYVSAGIERLNGLSAEALLRDSSLFYNQIVEEDRLMVAAAREASLQTMGVFNVVARFRREDDEIRWMNLCSAPRRLADGRVLWDGIEIDITERKQAEAELRRLKDYLANIIDSMPAALVGIDQAETVTQWNRQAEVLTGLPEARAIGRSIRTLLPEFISSIEALWEKSEQAGGPASLETVLLVRAGEREVFDLMLYPLVANGREGAVVRIENITERSRIQELMVQTEKMMSLGGLAAGMAHEINNPLGIISQAAQNIQRRVSPELPANQKAAAELGLPLDLMKAYFDRRDIPVFVRDIRDAVSRATKIVANMLQFSRKSGTERQPASLEEVLDRTVELAANDYDLRKHYDFRSIEIVREYQTELPAVPVVVVEIQQVLLNLLKNAAQAMADHHSELKPKITLRLKCEEKYAVLEVEDNGPGMDEKVARRVFEPFFTTKGPGIGTGLGLSVSYMIITQNHQGFISVQSSPGKGTRFAIKLPLGQRRQA
jgi:PAS domain S-box-containing protein